jgi:hypothetical protein
MEQEWIVRRQTVAQVDGQRRWDLAYQCLLRWTQTMRQEMLPIQTHQEAHYESRDLCPGVDPTASPNSDH